MWKVNNTIAFDKEGKAHAEMKDTSVNFKTLASPIFLFPFLKQLKLTIQNVSEKLKVTELNFNIGSFKPYFFESNSLILSGDIPNLVRRPLSGKIEDAVKKGIIGFIDKANGKNTFSITF